MARYFGLPFPSPVTWKTPSAVMWKSNPLVESATGRMRSQSRMGLPSVGHGTPFATTFEIAPS